MKRSDNTLLLILLVVTGAAGGAWYYWQQLNQSPVETIGPAPDDVAPAAPPRIGPIHPLEVSLPSSEDRELVPLPPLDDLDEASLFRLRDPPVQTAALVASRPFHCTGIRLL